eukprot:UN5135
MEGAPPCSSWKIGRNLRSFSSLSDFQKAALRLAAYRLEDQHVQEHRSAFRALDTDGDGCLSLNELSHGCPELGLSSEDAKRLFRQLDVDGSGTIEYTEFLGAAVSKSTLPRYALWEAFRVCDKDGDGVILPGEIEELVERLCSKEGPCPRPPSSRSLSTTASGSMLPMTRTNSNTDLEEMNFNHFMDLLRMPGRTTSESRLLAREQSGSNRLLGSVDDWLGFWLLAFYRPSSSVLYQRCGSPS